MTIIKTVCARDCYDVCSLNVSLDKNQTIRSIRGDGDHPVTEGRLCPRSAADKQRLHQNRITTPFVKENDTFRKTEWRKALDILASNLSRTLEQHGPEQVLFLTYAGNTGLLANAYPHRLWNAIGATQTDHALCSNSGHVGLSLHYGSSYGANPAEIPRAGLIVFWGINPAVSAPHLWQLAQQARKKGNKPIVVIDPIRTRSAEKADLWIRPKPETDVALAYGIIHHLIENNWIDSDFLQMWTTGFEHLKAEAAHWSPTTVEDLTGVRREDLRCLTELYRQHKPSFTLIGYGLQHCSCGADQVRAVSMIPAVLGLHRGFFYGNGNAYRIDMPYIKGESLSQIRSNIVKQVALADHLAQGDFKFVYVSCMNPALTLPNQRSFRKALREKDVFLAVHDTHWTRTADFAHAVLPAPTFLEKDDIIIPDSHAFVSWSEKVVSPVTDSRHEIEVMRQLAQRLNLNQPWLYENTHDALRHAMSHAFEAGDFDQLLSGSRLVLKRRPDNEYQTRSGKIELYSHEAVDRGWSPLPRFHEQSLNSFPFTYLTSAVAEYTHTQFQEIYGPIPALAYLHPDDAASLSIQAGDSVSVYNKSGSIRLEARISDRIPQKTIWSPKELEGLDGTSQNCLTSSRPQQIGSGPRFNSTRVGITKV